MSDSVELAIQRGEDPYVEQVDCWSCINLVCIACSNLNLQLKKKYGLNHCEKHCRHKKERSRIHISKGVDNRYKPRKG